MPEPKGRRRRGRQRERVRVRRPDAAAGRAPNADDRPRTASPTTVRPGAAPSPAARATGLVLAVVTAFLAGLLIKDSGGSVTAIVAGALLILLAVAVAVLVVAPGRVRALLRR